MKLMRPTFYVEPRTGMGVRALLQLLALLGAPVAIKLPSRAEIASYIVIDIERRRSRLGRQEWVDAWFDARAELDHPGILVGLTLEEDYSPVPGACQVPAFHVLPAIVQLLDKQPRPLTEAQLEMQKQPAGERQAQIVAHDLEHLLKLSDLNSDRACLTLEATMDRVTSPPLQSDLSDLLKQIRQVADSKQLRALLGTAIASWRKRYDQ